MSHAHNDFLELPVRLESESVDVSQASASRGRENCRRA